MRPDDPIVAGQRITNHRKDFKIDVVLALADGGVVSIEVKGGEITHDWAGWHTPSRRIDPVNQVRDRQVRAAQLVDRCPGSWTRTCATRSRSRRPSGRWCAAGCGCGAVRRRERVYVGLSRARDELVVCGDPAVVRAVGGDELAQRLGC